MGSIYVFILDKILTFRVRLVSTSKKHAARLHKTGEGIQDGNSETMDFYISINGPDESTPECALNIWSMLSYFNCFII